MKKSARKKRDGIQFYEVLLLIWLAIIAYNFISYSNKQQPAKQSTGD